MAAAATGLAVEACQVEGAAGDWAVRLAFPHGDVQELSPLKQDEAMNICDCLRLKAALDSGGPPLEQVPLSRPLAELEGWLPLLRASRLHDVMDALVAQVDVIAEQEEVQQQLQQPEAALPPPPQGLAAGAAGSEAHNGGAARDGSSLTAVATGGAGAGSPARQGSSGAKAEVPGQAPPAPGAARAMSAEERLELSRGIGALEGDRLCLALKIIADGPSAHLLGGGAACFDLDVDALDPVTCWSLQACLATLAATEGPRRDAAKGSEGGADKAAAAAAPLAHESAEAPAAEAPAAEAAAAAAVAAAAVAAATAAVDGPAGGLADGLAEAAEPGQGREAGGLEEPAVPAPALAPAPPPAPEQPAAGRQPTANTTELLDHTEVQAQQLLAEPEPLATLGVPPAAEPAPQPEPAPLPAPQGERQPAAEGEVAVNEAQDARLARTLQRQLMTADRYASRPQRGAAPPKGTLQVPGGRQRGSMGKRPSAGLGTAAPAGAASLATTAAVSSGGGSGSDEVQEVAATEGFAGVVLGSAGRGKLPWRAMLTAHLSATERPDEGGRPFSGGVCDCATAPEAAVARDIAMLWRELRMGYGTGSVAWLPGEEHNFQLSGYRAQAALLRSEAGPPDLPALRVLLRKLRTEGTLAALAARLQRNPLSRSAAPPPPEPFSQATCAGYEGVQASGSEALPWAMLAELSSGGMPQHRFPTAAQAAVAADLAVIYRQRRGKKGSSDSLQRMLNFPLAGYRSEGEVWWRLCEADPTDLHTLFGKMAASGVLQELSQRQLAAGAAAGAAAKPPAQRAATQPMPKPASGGAAPRGARSSAKRPSPAAKAPSPRGGGSAGGADPAAAGGGSAKKRKHGASGGSAGAYAAMMPPPPPATAAALPETAASSRPALSAALGKRTRQGGGRSPQAAGEAESGRPAAPAELDSRTAKPSKRPKGAGTPRSGAGAAAMPTAAAPTPVASPPAAQPQALGAAAALPAAPVPPAAAPAPAAAAAPAAPAERPDSMPVMRRLMGAVDTEAGRQARLDRRLIGVYFVAFGKYSPLQQANHLEMLCIMLDAGELPAAVGMLEAAVKQADLSVPGRP